MPVKTFAAIILLCSLPAFAVGNKCVSTATGTNWSSSTHWTSCGGGVPGNGDQATIANATTVDVNTTVGISPPPTPYSWATVVATGGGTTGGLLPAGVYRIRVSSVDSGSVEGDAGPENSFTIALGNIPRITLVATLGATRNIYLSAAGGATNTETLYASGITATTFDASSALWTNGTTTQAAAAVLPVADAIIINSGGGSLTIATGVTLTHRGDITMNNAPMTISAGGNESCDASTSVTPSTTYYWIKTAIAGSQSSSTFTSSGTSGSRNIISTVSGGASCFIAPFRNAGAGNYFTDPGNITISYTYMTRMGDSSHAGLVLANNSATRTHSIDHLFCSACVGVPSSGYTFPAVSTLVFTSSSWTSTTSGQIPWTLNAATVSTGARTVNHLRTDATPTFGLPGVTINDSFFNTDMTDNTLGTAVYTNDLFHLQRTGGLGEGGDITNAYAFATNSTFVSSGTLTSCTTSTVTDGSAPFPSGTYAYTNRTVFGVAELVITSGVDAGLVRGIVANTTSVLTTDLPIPACSNGDTYQIWKGLDNYHWMVPNPSSSARTWTFTNVIGEQLDADVDGDFWYGLNIASSSFNILNTLLLPGISGGNSGTLLTLLQLNTRPVTVAHCTYFTGQQSAAIGEQAGTGTANILTLFKANIAWSVPALQSNYSSSPFSNLGPYIVRDTGHGNTNATVDIITAGAADYNGSFGQATSVTGNSYFYTYSTTPGTNDVTGDPRFADSTRGLLKWGCTILSICDVNPYTRLGKIVNAILASNDTTDANYNANAIISGTGTALIDWVRAGFVPRNSLYNHTYPGDTNPVTNLGAIPGSFGVPAFGQIF